MSPRWRKVLKDLWGNKARSLLAVLSIAAGVFAVGMIGSAYLFIDHDMDPSYVAVHPAHGVITAEPFDDEMVEAVERLPGVETEIMEDKQGLGVTKRNKKRFEAQQMMAQLNALAHNLIVWSRRWLAQTWDKISSLGILRMVRDVFHLSGLVQTHITSGPPQCGHVDSSGLYMMRSSGYNTFGVLIGTSGVEFMPMITPVPSRG